MLDPVDDPTVQAGPAEVVAVEVVPMPTPEETLVRTYPPEVKAKIYELYLTTNQSFQELSIGSGVPMSTISYWIHAGEWRKKKEQLEVQLFKEADSKYRKFLEEKKLPVAQRHESIAAGIEIKIGEAADKIEADDPKAIGKLAQVSKALNEVSAVSARAVGLSDRPYDNEFNQSGNRKVPLVMIGIQGTPAVTVKE